MINSMRIFIDVENWLTYEYEQKSLAYMDFKVFEITGVEHGKDEDIIWYARKGATSSEDQTRELKDAETMCSGSIKFDGCIHLNFNSYLHFCGNPADKLKTIFDNLYALGDWE